MPSVVAPVVNIIGSNLIKDFDEAHDVQMRVGALPRYPQMK